MSDGPMISVVSPVYGCRDCLESLAASVREAFDTTDLEWELVLVDDRGPDQPWPLIQRLAEGDDRIRGVRLARNHGQHLAIWAGLGAAKGDYVAVIDCDLQDDPTAIPDLYQTLKASGDEAIVVDRGSWSDTRFRRAASSVFFWILRLLTGVSIQNIGNFGLYSRRMVDTLLLYREQEVFLPIMVTLTGLSTTRYELDRGDRHSGQSSYSLKRLIMLAAAIVVRSTDRPLMLSVFLGLAISGISAAISVALVLFWLMGAFAVAGWTSTILSLWFLSGLIMATLGVHGFYIGRIFREVQNRPRILIEQSTDDDSGPTP